MAPGSISARSGAGRVPRRSFQYSNRSRLDGCFILRPRLSVLRSGPCPIGTRRPCADLPAGDRAGRVPRACVARTCSPVFRVSVKLVPVLGRGGRRRRVTAPEPRGVGDVTEREGPKGPLFFFV